jgi:hypothetical protein
MLFLKLTPQLIPDETRQFIGLLYQKAVAWDYCECSTMSNVILGSDETFAKLNHYF